VTSTAEPTRRSTRLLAGRIVAICALVTAISQFYRNAHVVVAPDIMGDTGITAQTLGYLSGALFLTAAVLQIPAGILLDRYGPRRTIPFMLATVVAGSLMFASAQDATGLIVARVCMGVGLAAIGMAAIVASTRWFAPAYFGTVVGVILGVSYVGHLASTLPMAQVSAAIGWRSSYILVTIVTAVLAAAAAILVRDAPPHHPFHSRVPETMGAAWRGVGEILRVQDLWPLLAIAGTAYAVVACILGLWAGPYLFDMYGLDAASRGAVIIWFPVGMMLGNMLISPLDRILDTRKRIIVVCALATVAVLVALAVTPRPPLLIVTISFGMIGFLSAYTTVIIAHGRCFYSDRQMGRGVTVVNTAVLLGAGTMQAITGLIAGALAPGAASLPIEVYRIIFATLAAVLLAALFIYRRCPDVPPSAGADGMRKPSAEQGDAT
jgi:sugar phosphate permease